MANDNIANQIIKNSVGTAPVGGPLAVSDPGGVIDSDPISGAAVQGGGQPQGQNILQKIISGATTPFQAENYAGGAGNNVIPQMLMNNMAQEGQRGGPLSPLSSAMSGMILGKYLKGQQIREQASKEKLRDIMNLPDNDDMERELVLWTQEYQPDKTLAILGTLVGKKAEFNKDKALFNVIKQGEVAEAELAKKVVDEANASGQDPEAMLNMIKNETIRIDGISVLEAKRALKMLPGAGAADGGKVYHVGPNLVKYNPNNAGKPVDVLYTAPAGRKLFEDRGKIVSVKDDGSDPKVVFDPRNPVIPPESRQSTSQAVEFLQKAYNYSYEKAVDTLQKNERKDRSSRKARLKR